MPDAMLKTSLAGKIRNLRHFKSEALLPLFEAVINSIQAIEEVRDLKQGVITVRIKRDMRQGSLAYNGDDSSILKCKSTYMFRGNNGKVTEIRFLSSCYA